jgi:hypothetical protein
VGTEKIFDRSDILGIIIPGAGLIFGVALVFGGPREISTLEGLKLGALGVVVLCALVTGLCVRLVGWSFFWLIRCTPRDAFDRYVAKLTEPDLVEFKSRLAEAYAVKFEPLGRSVLFGSTKWQVETLLAISGRASVADRPDRQFTMISGLSVALSIVALSIPLAIKTDSWLASAAFDIGGLQVSNAVLFGFIALVFAILMGIQACRWANLAGAALVGWFAWLMKQDNWGELVRASSAPQLPTSAFTALGKSSESDSRSIGTGKSAPS